VLELFRKFVALAMEFVTRRRTWKEPGKRRNHSDIHYAEFPRSWSTRAERGLQEMDHMFKSNRRHLGETTQLQETQTPCHWQAPPKYQLYQHEEVSVQRTHKRRVMVVSNPDPPTDDEEEFEMKGGRW